MAIVKEWLCLAHGPFDGSHAICPSYGCDSRAVHQEFRTPVAIRSNTMKKFDAGIKQSAQMYNISDFRTAKAGEAAYGGDKGKELGMEVLWGDNVQKKMGRSFAELTGIAQKPLVVPKRDGSGTLRLDRNNAMREAATEMGITRRVVPRAGEVAGDASTPKPKAQALTV